MYTNSSVKVKASHLSNRNREIVLIAGPSFHINNTGTIVYFYYASFCILPRKRCVKVGIEGIKRFLWNWEEWGWKNFLECGGLLLTQVDKW